MRHAKKGRKIGTDASHRKAIFEGLARQLIIHERLKTTEAKAKELRPMVEKVITLGKRGDLHARRQALAVLHDREVVHKLFAEIERLLPFGFHNSNEFPPSLFNILYDDSQKL
ncbi:MAG: 50S ribosomal protein L17 [Rubrobacteridae bacterium]|nr:50S ribosomal protein L17 [Rubrobacteridae bacterium]